MTALPASARGSLAPIRRLLVVAGVLAAVAVPSSVLAQAGVGIDPGVIAGLPPIEADTPITVAVTVRNPGAESASYQMVAQPLSGEAELPIDPAWFSFEPATFDIGGGAAEEVTVTFTVPDGTNAGDYLGLLTAQLVLGESESSGAQVGAAVATKLYFTVPPAPETASSSGLPIGAVIGLIIVAVLAVGIVAARKSGLKLGVTRTTSR